MPKTDGETFFEGDGICPICESKVQFKAYANWFRDYLICTSCGSLPRERALMHVLCTTVPAWRELIVHESSPAVRGASKKMMDECPGYVQSQYDPTIPFGSQHPVSGYQSEDLEKQTFGDAIFDVVVTQDVFEHLFDPVAAAKEIARTLKPGGVHIFSVPIIRRGNPSARRAAKHGNEIVHIAEPQYHSNPISSEGALVTIDWGYDLLEILSSPDFRHSLYYIDDITQGIRAELIEIVVGRKMHGNWEI
jgi:SAM-dependent methyltransferase